MYTHKDHVRLRCEALEDRAVPATALALAGTSTLIRFDTATPNVVTTIGTITGLATGDSIVDLDFRPGTGQLYGLGSGSRIYTIDPNTAVATPVGASGAFTLNGTNFGFDFNPVPDRIRVTSDADQNLRLNPNDGTLTATDGTLAYAAGDPNAAANPNIVASAYTNSFGGATATTLYDLDSSLDTLVIQNPPNSGTLNTVVGAGLGINAQGPAGFDIQALTGGGNAAFAALSTNGADSSFYTINLTTGAATLVGAIGSTPTLVRGLAIVPEVTPSAVLYGINATNGNLVRFNSANPTTIIGSTPVTGLTGGDAIVGIDFRPATGQLYGLGSGSRIYTIDTTTGAATQVGSNGAFTLDGSNFYGFDFNPTVDRIRVTSINGQNIRLNPNDGTLAATDGTLAYAAGDPNTGNSPSVTEVAYTNSFAGSTTTTLYDLDAALKVLATQNPPNSGTLNTVGSLGSLVGSTFNTGFDIQPLAGGGNLAFATLGFAGGSSLYTIDLTTGAATQIGTGFVGGTTPLTISGLAAAPFGTFQFSAPTYSIGEAGPVAMVTVTRTLGSEGVATVRLTTSDGTATSGDYTSFDQVLVFAPGVTSQTVQIPITNDAIDEADETVDLTLTAATGGAVLGTQATAVLTVVDDDTAPVALADAYTTAQSTPLTVAQPGVLANDTDAESDPLTAAVVTNPANGTLTLNPDGSFAYAPNANFNGIDTFTYRASDGTNLSNIATVTVTVTAANGTPPSAPGANNVAPVAAGPNLTFTVNGVTTTVTPFAGFTGRVTTASGDVTGDGVADVIAGAGINGHVKVFDGATGAEVRSFLAFGAFTGGTYVASGDVNDDGFDDVIVGATVNGHVKVFSGRDGTELRSFLAYSGFTGEVRVGSGDINGDGVDDLITGAGSGANGHVKVFSGPDNAEIRSFLAYATFNGGIFVAGGDVNGDGRDDIVTGADANGHVKVFSGTDNTEIRSFLAFPNGFAGSARVEARPVNGDAAADLLVGSGPGRSPVVRTFDGLTLALLSEEPVSDPLGLGVFVG